MITTKICGHLPIFGNRKVLFPTRKSKKIINFIFFSNLACQQILKFLIILLYFHPTFLTLFRLGFKKMTYYTRLSKIYNYREQILSFVLTKNDIVASFCHSLIGSTNIGVKYYQITQNSIISGIRPPGQSFRRCGIVNTVEKKSDILNFPTRRVHISNQTFSVGHFNK